MPFKTLSDLAESSEFIPLVGNGTSHYNLLKVNTYRLIFSITVRLVKVGHNVLRVISFMKL